ncbi:tetratricopeptide repeat protein [Mucilaginibacter calamicampi]|uniref:Tetratricopeptide repeat protein n=1 Tax=Mucilaginibacter calamicampi TaxID=1302352 RepID=A0ABW2YTA1_9SPHI
MKIRILFVSAGLATLFAAPVFAQKGEVSNAKSAFETYDALRAANNGPLVKNALSKAKIAIDKASQNEKTSALPETYALKAAIYAHAAMADTIESTSAPIFGAAEEALVKAKDLDTKKENDKLIASAEAALAQGRLNAGVSLYRDKKYDDAYKAFDASQKYSKGDTSAMYYAGISAAAGKNYKGAIDQYKRLITTNFSENDKVYMDLSSLYLTEKDTVNALNVAGEAVKKFPANTELRKREIEISLQAGKVQEVLDKIISALKNDPKNKTLYLYAGLIYSQTADGNSAKIAKTKDAATIAALQKDKADNYAKASEMYKKAIEIDPTYFDAVLNLGYVTLNPAIDTYNAAQQLPAAKQKEYDAALLKAKTQFDAAKPYLEKATELQPNSTDAWKNLKTYYIGVQNAPKANEIQKKIDAIETKK